MAGADYDSLSVYPSGEVGMKYSEDCHMSNSVLSICKTSLRVYSNTDDKEAKLSLYGDNEYVFYDGITIRSKGCENGSFFLVCNFTKNNREKYSYEIFAGIGVYGYNGDEWVGAHKYVDEFKKWVINTLEEENIIGDETTKEWYEKFKNLKIEEE